jgi:uncharacterized repeat protein (TIGR03803 family)
MKILRIPLVIALLVAAGRALNANAQTETVLYSFDKFYDPRAGLVQGSDGNFYGTTFSGGNNGWGTVFRISPSGNYLSLFSSFTFAQGVAPQAGLVQGSDGNFYGTTYAGGANNLGNIFRISPSGTYTTLYMFGNPYQDGGNPLAGLVQGSDGNFYGTTSGLYVPPNVFRISPSGTYTSLYSFAGGGCPWGLVQGSDGNFYGTTQLAEVYRITPSGAFTPLYIFGSSPNDGYMPLAGLVQGSDGNFYGTTYYGGTSTNCYEGCGTIFRISPSGTYTSLYSFVGSPDGATPAAGLVQGSDGNFYGTTQNGGSGPCAGGCGTVFRISPSGNETVLYNFVGPPNDGYNLQAGLVQGSDGNFYGTTASGGTNNGGTVFKIDVGLVGCGYSINPNDAVFDAAGGSGSIAVTANSTNCEWTAISTVDWITITCGYSGFGNGTVEYSVATNTSSSTLTGTVIIGGQTFTVIELAPGGADCVPPPSGMVAWWPGDGNANDIVGGNNGALVNGAGFAPGVVGQAFSVNGVNQTVTVPSSPSLSFGTTSPMTLELWAYRTSSADSMHIIGKRNACADLNYQMAVNMGTGEGLCFGDGIGNEVASGLDLPINTWTHLAGTFDGATFSLYVNGVLMATQAGTLGPMNSAPLEFGDSGTCPMFDGLIDEVSIYNRALSPNEIAAIYNAGRFGKCKPVTSELTSISVSNTTAILNLLTTSNYYYDVQSTTDLVYGAWSTIASNIPGLGGTTNYIDLNGATVPQKFYRVGMHFGP